MLQPVHKSLFIESNPAPAKYAAKLLGLCDDEIRLPLVKIKKETETKTAESHLTRIRGKLMKIKSEIQIKTNYGFNEAKKGGGIARNGAEHLFLYIPL